ncbi:MAG: hypothetical protein IIA90_07590 [Chloroflexi bacterium]|nr:hypothetical protein [Chloroflexota bacterium]
MTAEEILLRLAGIRAAGAGAQWIGDPQGRAGQVVISLTMPPESPIEEPARSDR